MTDDTETIRRRVDALLAKAASTEFAEEADALFAKAHQLMAEHAIDQADLRGADPGRMGRIDIEVFGRWAGPRQDLLHGIASANRCATCISRRRGSRKGTMSVFGDRSDLETTKLLYAAVEPQLLARVARVQHPERDQWAAFSTPAEMAALTRQWRKSFAFGFAARIGQRLVEAGRAAEAASADPQAAGLALTDATDRARRHMTDQLGRLRADRMSRSVRGDAYSDGVAAANAASLATGGLPGGRRALRSAR
ncbi:MAG: DUF2786 domain-containing protein [Acidimicrobiales bacterium]